MPDLHDYDLYGDAVDGPTEDPWETPQERTPHGHTYNDSPPEGDDD